MTNLCKGPNGCCNEYAVEYLYEGKWIEFSQHVSLRDAGKDKAVLAKKYETRIRELRPSR